MHTTGHNAKNNPIANKAKDISAPPPKKFDGASLVPQVADKAKDQRMPEGQKAATDGAKESCGGIGKDGKPHHMAGCSCANKSASHFAADKPADNNGTHKVQGGSADHAASTLGAKQDNSTTNPLPKTAEKHEAHK